MPRDLTEEAVAKWLGSVFIGTRYETRSSKQAVAAQARAVLALVEAKVREGVAHPRERVVAQSCGCCSDVVEITPDEIVARVMNKEAPRV